MTTVIMIRLVILDDGTMHAEAMAEEPESAAPVKSSVAPLRCRHGIRMDLGENGRCHACLMAQIDG